MYSDTPPSTPAGLSLVLPEGKGWFVYCGWYPGDDLKEPVWMILR